MFIDQQKYRLILEAMPDGIFILDRELIVHYLNPSIITLLNRFGLTADLIGKKFTAVFPESVPYLQEEIDRVYETRVPLRAAHSVHVASGDITYETARIPMFGSDGTIDGVINIIHDTTDRIAAEQELRRSRWMFETMVDNANSVILRMDLEGRVTYFNRFAERFFGFPREEILGRSVQDTIIPPTDSEGNALRDLIKKIVANPAAFAANENENIRKDGTRVWMSWTNKPVIDDSGKVLDILAVGNDITVLKRTQRELEQHRDHLEELVRQRTEELVRADRLASLGTLVSGVAHEINNPNNFIILNADNLVDIWIDARVILDGHAENNPGTKIAGLPYGVLREEMDHLISGIREGARRIRTIVTNLKDFARQGPVDMEREVDMGLVVEAAASIVSNSVKKCTGKFEVYIEPQTPKVRGDFQKIEQVIINLLSNACQALTDRTQGVFVRVESDSDGAMVRLTVRDEGRGIAPDILPHIFDPFFTTKRKSGGTGLGLSISYGIVKDHHGTMTAASEPGCGACFTVTLPAYTSKEFR